MTLDTDSIALLTSILGELALISICYGSVCRLNLNSANRQVAHGILFGVAAIISTIAPIAFSNGVHIDGHTMMLAYSAAFGGPITFLIAALFSSLYKVSMSLPLSWTSLITLSVTGTIGLAWKGLVRPRLGLSVRSLVVLGLMSSSQILLFFLMPFEIAIAMILRTLPVAMVSAIAGAILIGKFIEREMRRIDLENRLLEEANTDALTGLHNRRAFEMSIADLDSHAHEASVMVVDIDHFKAINDDFGHEAGDQVLRAVAGCLYKTLGRRGQAYRTGGEEFTLLLPDVSLEAAVTLAERVRLAVSRLVYQNTPRQITVSVGISSTGPTKGAMLAVRQADKALYVAKSAGRNRCIEASELNESLLSFQARSAA